jgi:hypothetical protein
MGEHEHPLRAVACGRGERLLQVSHAAHRDRLQRHAEAARNGILGPTILLKGRVAGTWTRRLANGRVAVALTPFAALGRSAALSTAAAAARYGRFLGRPIDIH